MPSRIAQVGPQEPPAPFASLRAKGAPLRGGSLLWTTWTIRSAEAKDSHLTTLQQITTDLERHRHAGKPKLSSIAKGLIARGLMRLDASGRFPRLFFTEAGLAELRAMMMNRRLADPKKFAHVRQELGIDPRLDEDTQPD